MERASIGVKLERGEFVRRFAMHIQPRGSKRLRYAGLFTARGRDACLALCSTLIAQWQSEQPVATAPAKVPAISESEEQEAYKTALGGNQGAQDGRFRMRSARRG